MKKNRDYSLPVFITSCLEKNCSVEFSAEFRYVCKRSLVFIKDPEIIYLVEKLSADNLANAAPGLPYILIPDDKKPNEIKNNIENNGN